MGVNLIGFGGRLSSGKSFLGSITENHGFKRLYFALPLKEMCSRLLKISVNDLNRLKTDGTLINFKINANVVDKLSDETNLPTDIINEKIGGMVIPTVREMLQILGTDLIRGCNPDWHINKLKEIMNDGKKYVFDDVRFPNEKKFIEDMGGECWFVIRPQQFSKISHHISEESLRWQMFGDNVIVNNKSYDFIKMTWENFIDNYDSFNDERQKILTDISFKGWDKWNNSYIKAHRDDPFNLLNQLFISCEMFRYKRIPFNDVKDYKQSNNGKELIIEKTDGSRMILANPFNIEDFKFLT